MSTPDTNEAGDLHFLHSHIDQIQEHMKSSTYASVTNEHQNNLGKMYFREGYRTANNKTNKLFIVLRGLPGCGASAFANGVLSAAVNRGVKSTALLSTDDYFYDSKGNYVFDKDKLTEYHRRNFERACHMFLLGVEVVILDNYNIKKSHYRHYVTSAQSHGYVIAEMTVGTVNPTEHEIETYSKNTEGRVPISVIRVYSNIFEQ